MSEKMFSKNAAIVLGTACIVLGLGLAGLFTCYFPIVNNANSRISALESEISQLNANLTHLQDQLGGLITPVFNVHLIASAPDNWENETVVVEGKLTGPLAYFTAISWYYELSTNGTVLPQDALGTDFIGVDLGARGRDYNADDVFVIGVVRKGFIGTLTAGERMVSYYIEAEFVIPK